MTKIILIRHGETIWNVEKRRMGHLDKPLTALGEQQIAALGRRFQNIHFNALYSSDLPRAMQTAQAIAASSGKTVRSQALLRERNLGVFQGSTSEELAQRFPDHWRSYLYGDYLAQQEPRGESQQEFYTRAVTIFNQLAAQHPDETVVAVSHGGLIASVLRYVMQLQNNQEVKFSCANTSFNVFSLSDAQWTLQTWGDVSHLTGLNLSN